MKRTIIVPDDSLGSGADGFQTLISPQDCKLGIANLHRVELIG
jgi:hypothetical protein